MSESRSVAKAFPMNRGLLLISPAGFPLTSGAVAKAFPMNRGLLQESFEFLSVHNCLLWVAKAFPMNRGLLPAWNQSM